MHKTRIVISVNPKIVLNSKDVHFGISRKCAHVGLKNMNIFNNKNHLCRSARNRKTFFRKRFTS
jgi:hypothetical protein